MGINISGAENRQTSFAIMLIPQQAPGLISTQDEIIQVELQRRKKSRTLKQFALKEHKALLLGLLLITLR
jgi:hypothetical protein